MKTLKGTILVLAVAAMFGCSSKKTKTDATDALSPAISNDPMSFAAQGSDSGKIAGLNTIHFEFDRAVIDKKDREILKENASWIKTHSDVKVQIEGHCDHQGSAEYNLALGDRRAKAVYHALLEMGIPKHRLTTISYGDERPIAQGSTEDAYAQNRRANFVPLNMQAPAASPHLAGTER